MVLVWQIAVDSPYSPNLLPAKLSRYTVSGMYNNNTTLELCTIYHDILYVTGDKLVTISYWDHSVIEFSKESCDAVIVNVNIKVSGQCDIITMVTDYSIV